MPNDKVTPTVELGADVTDTVVDQSITGEDFYPHYKVLIKQDGVIKFKLYQHCPCSVSIRFEFETQGVALHRDVSKCDLCTDQNQDNAERIGAVMDGFRVVSEKVMELGKAQEVFADAVKDKTGRDLRNEGMSVATNIPEGEFVSFKQAEDVRSDAQILLVCALELAELIDINKINPDQRDEYVAVVRLIEGIRVKDAFTNPTDKVRTTMAKLKHIQEKVIKKVKTEYPEASEDEIVKILIKTLKQSKNNDKENLS